MNKFDYIFLAGLGLWLVETACFGWNFKTSGVPESMFNVISLLLMGYGFSGGLIAAYKNPHTVIRNKKKLLLVRDYTIVNSLLDIYGDRYVILASNNTDESIEGYEI